MRQDLRRRMLPILGVALMTGAALAGCGSSSHSSSAVGSQSQRDCTAVADVLSDGPDPDADPVGYAEAQVLPLQHLQVDEPNLQSAVKNLASAYQAVATASNASLSSAEARASQAASALNAICPGAAS